MQDRLKELVKGVGFSPEEVYPLKESSSGCKFYRLKDNKKSAILLFVDGRHKDFDSYIEISNFLSRIGGGVPEIYSQDRESKFIIEEDLGDLTLQRYILETADFNFYKKVIDELLLMQIMGGKKVAECKCVNDKTFDYNAFRWETWYFMRYFLEVYCGMRIDNRLELEHEFHTLAMEIVDEPLYFMHRDFQSQNILIKEGKIRIVDFQGARRGLLVYDLASLLKDAYVEIGEEMREELIGYYLHCLSKWDINFEPSYFWRIFQYAGLQRNMQALGAFAFLSGVEHKSQFSQYIPITVKYLINALEQIQEFPELFNLLKRV